MLARIRSNLIHKPLVVTRGYKELIILLGVTISKRQIRDAALARFIKTLLFLPLALLLLLSAGLIQLLLLLVQPLLLAGRLVLFRSCLLRLLALLVLFILLQLVTWECIPSSCAFLLPCLCGRLTGPILRRFRLFHRLYWWLSGSVLPHGVSRPIASTLLLRRAWLFLILISRLWRLCHDCPPLPGTI